jgi:hypothetical protein
LENVAQRVGDDAFAIKIHEIQKTHRVCFSSPRIAVHKDKTIIAIIALALLICLDEDVINKFLAADIKDLHHLIDYLEMSLSPIENIIKLIHFIFKGGFDLDFLLAYKANLVAIIKLSSIIWFKFNKYLNFDAGTFNLSSLYTVCCFCALRLGERSWRLMDLLKRLRGDSFVLFIAMTNEYYYYSINNKDGKYLPRVRSGEVGNHQFFRRGARKEYDSIHFKYR